MGKAYFHFFYVLRFNILNTISKYGGAVCYLTLKGQVNAYHMVGLLETLWTGLAPRPQQIRFESAE